jgi:hypothetical protein
MLSCGHVLPEDMTVAHPSVELGQLQRPVPRSIPWWAGVVSDYLTALAVRFDSPVRVATARDCAQLARLGQVTRARLTPTRPFLETPVP